MSKQKATKKSAKIDTKALVKAADARKKEAAKAEADKVKQAAIAAKQKKGALILLAAEKGREMTKAVTGDHYLNGLQKALGGDYTLDAVSLTLNKGVKPTEESLTKLIAGLAGATEGLRKAEGSTTFALGDACLIAKESFPDQVENIILQASNIAGREPHTIQQAMRVAEFFPKEERVEGLTFTHFQEGMNYAREKGTDKLKITKGALHKMFEEAFVVEGVPITKADGKDIDARKEAISVRQFRERLQEKVGKKPTSKKSKSKASSEVDPDEHLFFYINDDGDVKYSIGIDLAVTKKGDHLVIDATDRTVINDKGAVHFLIKELEKDEPVNVVPMPEKPKAEKPKKELPKKKVSGMPD